jgi:hypothetical protein
MRTARLLALAFIALAVPLSRSAAQTCLGMAAFQDGRMRAGVDDQVNSDFNGVRSTLEYGRPRSIYGGISMDGLNVDRPGRSTSGGLGLNLGYQIQINDTPLQFCPGASWQYSSGGADNATQGALGGALGYRLRVSDWFTVVPAAGVWFISTRTAPNSNVLEVVEPAPGPSTTASTRITKLASNQIFLTTGLVFRKALTVSPGVIFPSQNGAKQIYTLGVSINWAK